MSGTVGDNVYRASGVIAAAAAAAGGVSWQAVETGATMTAVAGNGYPIDTTANACTVTLPASAEVGDEIIFTDYARNFATNALTINTNSLKYQGNTSPNPVYDTKGESIHIVYMDATKGWIPTYDGAVALETPQWSGSASYLVVGGGGSGGRERGGGGGAGGYRTNYSGSAYTLGTGITYTITVGAGGAAVTSNGVGNDGEDSVFSGSDITDVTATGGGGGSGSSAAGGDGGSGGGAMDTNAKGAGNDGGDGGDPSIAEGYDGADVVSAAPGYGSGGGGGSAAVGFDGTGSVGGNGGTGTANAITGASVTYAGGGGGGIYLSIPNIGVGAGGGGNGGSGGNGSENQQGTPGTDGTGGGGGGAPRCGSFCGDGQAGGDGIVIIRIATDDYDLVTITGTYTTDVDGSDTAISWSTDGTLVT